MESDKSSETMNDLVNRKYNDNTISGGTGYFNNYNNPPTKISILKLNKKTLFYYWAGNCFLYCLYEGQDEIVFTQTYNFIEVLEELGMLKK